jgi:hypothetical protein
LKKAASESAAIRSVAADGMDQILVTMTEKLEPAEVIKALLQMLRLAANEVADNAKGVAR